MGHEISRVDVWVGEIEDRPEALPEKLDVLLKVGANLEFAIVRPSAHIMSDKSLLLVAPLEGAEQERAARSIGLERAGTLHTLRVLGPDRPGRIADITRKLAQAGIRISDLWAAAFAGHSAQYIRLESGAEAKRAAKILAPLLS